jgi:hypothetical protein
MSGVLGICCLVCFVVVLYLGWRVYTTFSDTPSDSSSAMDEAKMNYLATTFEKLGDLHRQGRLTDEEFEAAKANALANPFARVENQFE